jgi:hypothetical protein
VKSENLPDCWPRLLDIHRAAQYLSLGEATIRDYTAAKILQPVHMPGSLIRDGNGEVIARPGDRRMVKFLFDKNDLDAFVDRLKREVQ